MARALRIQFPGAYYHITCRGIERRKIYNDTKDRTKFITLLKESLEIYQVVLHAYVMMGNHFHFLVQTRKANCSEFMRHFNIRYTGWFNWRYERSGNLYQGRYHAYLIDADNYLLEVSRYVHLNPVRARPPEVAASRERWHRVINYPWSSLGGYIDEKQALGFIDYDMVLSMVNGRRAYGRFIMDGLRHSIENPFDHVQSQMILGDSDFVASVKGHLHQGSTREQPAYRKMTMNTMDAEVILEILRRVFGSSMETLTRRGSEGVIRGIAADMLYKYCDMTLAEIGRRLGGIDYMAVSLLRRRLRDRMSLDEGVKRKYDELESKIRESM
jgi:REP element-mobilizing transposase RayT